MLLIDLRDRFLLVPYCPLDVFLMGQICTWRRPDNVSLHHKSARPWLLRDFTGEIVRFSNLTEVNLVLNNVVEIGSFGRQNHF